MLKNHGTIVARRVVFMKLDRITVDPQVCMGQPTIRGTRITVAFVLKLLASGMDVPVISSEERAGS